MLYIVSPNAQQGGAPNVQQLGVPQQPAGHMVIRDYSDHWFAGIVGFAAVVAIALVVGCFSGWFNTDRADRRADLAAWAGAYSTVANATNDQAPLNALIATRSANVAPTVVVGAGRCGIGDCGGQVIVPPCRPGFHPAPPPPGHRAWCEADV